MELSSDPLISIVVPIFNKEQLLLKCVESILRQTYKNFEILLVNDGSTDNSKNIIDNLGDQYPCIKIFHERNRGVSVARNIGIENAEGHFITFVDPDDSLEQQYLEVLLHNSIKYGAEISIISANVEVNGELKENPFFIEAGLIEKERAIKQLYDSSYMKESAPFIDVGVPWGKLYDLNFLKKHDLKFNIKLLRNQDNIFNLYAFQYANRLYYDRTALYDYNYDNFGDYGMKYMENAMGIYYEYAVASIEFHNQFYKDDRICEMLLIKKLESILMTILSRYIFHPKNPMSRKDKIKLTQEYISSWPFNVIFDNHKSGLFREKTNIRIIMSLIKNKRFQTLANVYLIKFLVRNFKK